MIASKIKKVRERLDQLNRLERAIKRQNILLGQQMALHFRDKKITEISEAEFSVTSQFGEDGIIQYLISHMSISNPYFVEIGTEDYEESNTRFLLQNLNYKGLLIEANPECVQKIRQTDLVWRHTLDIEQTRVEPDNIESIFAKYKTPSDLALLSIDIDGMDYWVWNAINSISPSIVVMEYNHRFGPDQSVTVPYSKNFDRSEAHYSNIYFGASLAALTHLAKAKKYSLVGCNRAGNNAFFVRNDKMEELTRVTGLVALNAKQAWKPGLFREARLKNGELAFLSAAQESKLIEGLAVTQVG